jgi:hypothetical protein
MASSEERVYRNANYEQQQCDKTWKVAGEVMEEWSANPKLSQ